SQKRAFIEMQARFFVLMTVGKKPGNQMNDKMSGTAMTRMLDLGNILELINDGLNDGPLTKQELVVEMHKLIFHVLTQFRDELESLFKKQGGQGSRDVALITNELAS